MSQPTLSVVIPNYNDGELLPVSLQALLDQSVQPLEIIIVDDASTDNSVAIIQSFAAKHPHLKLLRNEKNQGINYNLNLGIKEARGNYLLFSAADDKVLPGFIEKSMQLLAQHPTAGLCCTITTLYEPHTGLKWHLGAGMAEQPTYFSPLELLELEKSRRVFIPSNTVIWRRECLAEAGGFRPELKWHADTFLVHAIAFRHGICHVPEPLGYVNVEPDSYFQGGRSNEAAHRDICERIMELLTSPQFEKQGELMSQAGTFYRLEGCIFSVLWRNRRYRRLITWPFIRKHLWYTLQVKLKPYTPAFIGNLYLKLTGYRAESRP